ncbi:MAG: OmpH family outer membrane protein [bacterium]
MVDESKYRKLYDVALYGIPLLLIVAGIYFVRSPKVGVVNMDRVAQEIGVADRVRECERKWMNGAFAQLNEISERARPQVAALEARLASSDEAGKKSLQEQIRRLQTEVQSAADRSRQEFQLYRDGLRHQFKVKIDPVVGRIASSRHYDVVIDASEVRTVAFARPGVDITGEVIKASRSVVSNLDFGVLSEPTGKTPAMSRKDFSSPASGGVKK